MSGWFCVKVRPADATWGPRLNRYRNITGRRTVGVAVYFGRVGISLGKYLP